MGWDTCLYYIYCISNLHACSIVCLSFMCHFAYMFDCVHLLFMPSTVFDQWHVGMSLQLCLISGVVHEFVLWTIPFILGGGSWSWDVCLFILWPWTLKGIVIVYWNIFQLFPNFYFIIIIKTVNSHQPLCWRLFNMSYLRGRSKVNDLPIWMHCMDTTWQCGNFYFESSLIKDIELFQTQLYLSYAFKTCLNVDWYIDHSMV